MMRYALNNDIIVTTNILVSDSIILLGLHHVAFRVQVGKN